MGQSWIERVKSIEYLGWAGFVGFFVLYAGPGIWLAFEFTYEGTISLGARIVLGLVIASVLSGITTFLVDDLLHRRNVRRYEAERKQERKAKKKKKK